MKIMTVGGATTDIFIENEHIARLEFEIECERRSFLLFEEGRKLGIEKLYFHTGGGATNTAVSFKRLGFEVATVLKTGSDSPAAFIMQRLKETGIDTSFVQTSKEHITGHSLIFPCANGDRTVLAYRGANTDLKEADIPRALGEYNAYITSLSGASASILIPLTRILKENNRTVAVNPGSHQLTSATHNVYEALSAIDIFIVNSNEACCFMRAIAERDAIFHQKMLQTRGRPSDRNVPQLLQAPLMYESILLDMRLFFKKVLEHGPSIVAVTNGAEGVYVATNDEIIFHPSIPIKPVNTVGAGDAFGSCFVAKYLQGASIKEAVLYGILNATSVLQHLDAKSGLLTSDELERRFQQAPKDKFYIFKHT